MLTEHPKSLSDPETLAQRRTAAAQSRHLVPLDQWCDDLESARSAPLPRFDPDDAGTRARVLLLLETPGPMADAHSARPGSGFVSVDNADAVSANLWRARKESGLIDGVLCAAVVPWRLSPPTRKPTPEELAEGAAWLRDLVDLLPDLHTVVALGKTAQAAWRDHALAGLGRALRTIDTWHPSALVLNAPGRRHQLAGALGRARRDWRGQQAPRELSVDEGEDGRRTAVWYTDGYGDRIDIGPAWWDVLLRAG